MKIILSRKGFDSGCGGYPSPILPDGRLISLPIPGDDSMYYSKLKIEGLKSAIKTYYDLMTELHTEIKIQSSEKWCKLTDETPCHLDPDIRKEVSDEDWKPIFGQTRIAQRHLHNQGVDKGDLFLFFGRFRQTEWNKEGNLEFVEKEPVLHIIFGYLYVEAKYCLANPEEQKEWMKGLRHPHIKYMEEHNKQNSTLNRNNRYKYNTIYVASKSFSLNGLTFKPGYGVLDFSDEGVLTNRKLEKSEQSCSKWLLPKWLKDKCLNGQIKISYHDKCSCIDEEGCFKSADRGQEFVVKAIKDDDVDLKEWAKKIICSGTPKPELKYSILT